MGYEINYWSELNYQLDYVLNDKLELNEFDYD